MIISAGVNLSLAEKVKRQISKSSLKDTVDIGFLGSLAWWQGVDILVQAAAILKEKVPNLRIVIIGDGESRHSVEELCKSLDIPYEITGFVSHEDALKRLGTLDVMVLPRKKNADHRISYANKSDRGMDFRSACYRNETPSFSR